jgi:NADPH:quinone reductase-like Zn-dependent oxidoreductase
MKITEEIVRLVLEKKIRPVIGRVVSFEDLPAAMEAMAHRETVGRTIIQL